MKLGENPKMPYPQYGRSIHNNDAPSITKYGSLVWPHTQIVALRAHFAKCAPKYHSNCKIRPGRMVQAWGAGQLSFFFIKYASSESARCRKGKVQQVSTDFGSARVSIRASAPGWAPMVSRGCGCHHVSRISHSFGSHCAFCRFGSGCNGTSHKVGSHCSRGRFRMKYIVCRACVEASQYRDAFSR